MRHLVSSKVIGSFLVVCALVGTAALGLGRDGLPLASAEEDVVALDEADNGSTVDLRGDQELVIDLEGNLSTGYLWEVASVNDIFLRQVGQFEFEHYSDGVGSVGRQTLRFRAAGEGRTDLVLAYRRSWENAAPLRTFSVSVQTAGPITTIDDVYTGVVPPSPSRDAGPISSAAVPATYEWCSGGGCTPVKDQGICGSCWAFATSGVVESLIKISDGVTRDLSEQYLVSCNIDGWGCDGGSKAFDYFIDTYAPAELAAGAVYESNYPYTSGSTGSTGTCTGSPHTKYEKLISWHSVDGGEYPSVAAIKQAIYDYGPVYVSVCAGPAFQDYSGGIFSTDESATCSPYPTNHGVVLVGWNDSQGVWYLRNSWGTSWGETLAGAGGYMRIAYGTSNVGRSPAYAVYQPSSNVSITKDVVGSDFAPGDSITFTLSVQNSGTLTATTPIVTDTIPAEVLTPTFSSTLAVTPTGVISYVWEVEPLTPGQSGVITVCGWIDSGLESDFSFTNEATISDPDDVTPGNNTSSATVGERYVYLPLVMRSYPPPPPNTFYSVGDACILQGYATTNFGNTTDMWAGYDDYLNPDGRIARSLIQFDVSAIPAGTSIDSAVLRVYLVSSYDYPGKSRTITTYRISSSWSESSVTWNTSPSYAQAYGSASVTHGAWGWYSFNVTSLVRGWVNGTLTNYGIMLRGPEWSGTDSSWKAFATRESGTTYTPYLQITYGDGAFFTGRNPPTIEGALAPAGCGPAIADSLDIDVFRFPGHRSFETVEIVPCAPDE